MRVWCAESRREMQSVRFCSAHVKWYFFAAASVLHRKEKKMKNRKKRAEKLNNYVQLDGITHERVRSCNEYTRSHME